MLNKIEINPEIKNKLMESFPTKVLKTKPGKNGAPYVSGSSVTDKLNATFGYAGWEWAILKSWVEESVDKIVDTKWVNGKKINLTPAEYIVEKQLPVCHVIGRLTVHLQKEDGSIISISKEAPGAQPIMAGQTNQENCYKGAHTDALKKAATLFGIALELYRKTDGDHDYFNDINYENPWTPELSEKLKNEIEYVYGAFEANGYSESNIEEVVLYVTNNAEVAILPTNIKLIYDYLKSIEEEEKDGNK